MTSTEFHDAELCLVGAMVLDPRRLTDWRPSDDRLFTILETVASSATPHDVAALVDRLYITDPEYPWAALICNAMHRADEVLTRLTELKPLFVALQRVADSYERLDRSVDLIERARSEAERVYQLVDDAMADAERIAHALARRAA